MFVASHRHVARVLARGGVGHEHSEVAAVANHLENEWITMVGAGADQIIKCRSRSRHSDTRQMLVGQCLMSDKTAGNFGTSQTLFD